MHLQRCRTGNSNYLTAQQVALFFGGIQRLSCSSPVAIALLNEGRRILRCSEVLPLDVVSRVLFGLRNLRCDSYEVRQLLAVVGDLISRSEGSATPLEAAMMLNGLRSFSSETEEVRIILRKLVRFLDPSTVSPSYNVNGGIASMATQGLQRLLNSSPEVTKIVEYITRLLQACRSPLQFQEVNMILGGLRVLDPKSPGASSLLREIARLVSEGTILPFTEEQEQEIMANMGLLRHNVQPEFLELIRCVKRKAAVG